jgi:hypothetical protein
MQAGSANLILYNIFFLWLSGSASVELPMQGIQAGQQPHALLLAWISARQDGDGFSMAKILSCWPG